MTKKVLTKFVRVAFTTSVGLPIIFASSASAQLPAPAVPANPAAPPAAAAGTDQRDQKTEETVWAVF